MKGGRFNPGQAYVAFSGVKTLKELHILNFSASAIKKGSDVHNENDQIKQTCCRLCLSYNVMTTMLQLYC